MKIFGIPVTVENDNGEVLVSDDVICQYGVGDTLPEAVANYQAAVIEYREDLESSKEYLGSVLKQHLEYLNERLL